MSLLFFLSPVQLSLNGIRFTGDSGSSFVKTLKLWRMNWLIYELKFVNKLNWVWLLNTVSWKVLSYCSLDDILCLQCLYFINTRGSVSGTFKHSINLLFFMKRYSNIFLNLSQKLSMLIELSHVKHLSVSWNRGMVYHVRFLE